MIAGCSEELRTAIQRKRYQSLNEIVTMDAETAKVLDKIRGRL